MSKKVPVVKVATPDEELSRLAGLPLEAAVAMADVAGAMREGLLAFSAAGLVVMHQMLTEELASIVGPKHARSRLLRRWGTGTGPRRARS